jgi:hypothetical protein
MLDTDGIGSGEGDLIFDDSHYKTQVTIEMKAGVAKPLAVFRTIPSCFGWISCRSGIGRRLNVDNLDNNSYA